MKKGALFVGFGAPLPGREMLALEIFDEAKQFFEGLKKKGQIVTFEPFLLSHHGGPLRGFFMLHGEPIELATLITREDFIQLTDKASLAVTNLTVAPAFAADAIPALLETFKTVATDFVARTV